MPTSGPTVILSSIRKFQDVKNNYNSSQPYLTNQNVWCYVFKWHKFKRRGCLHQGECSNTIPLSELMFPSRFHHLSCCFTTPEVNPPASRSHTPISTFTKPGEQCGETRRPSRALCLISSYYVTYKPQWANASSGMTTVCHFSSRMPSKPTILFSYIKPQWGLWY